MFRGRLRTEITAGLIVSALMVLLIQPICKAVWGFLVHAIPPVLYRLIDSAYKNASLGNRPWASAFTLIVVFALVGEFFVIVSVGRLIPRSVFQKWRQRKHETAVKLRRLVQWLKVPFVICSVYLAVASWWLAFMIYVDMQLNASFEQRLAVLASVVPDQTIKSLRAEWADMHSRADYLQINRHMNELAAQQKRTLPNPLLR
jgi:hypothetical protein